MIEEAPAPGMDEATREDICAAAVRAAKAVDYEGAGTIEFIADASEGLRADRIFFMEMNTRLQVEHPVTEEITGVDLVEWQLRVASGEPVPKRQEELSINGHAIEARLYAEDPAKGFLPSTGRLERYHLPDTRYRVDSGVEQHSAISPFYDPMIAKIIVHDEDRDEAIISMLDALEGTAVWPVKSNTGFLFRAVNSATFKSGEFTTGFIEQHGESLIPSSQPDDEILGQGARRLIEDYGNGTYHSLDNERLEGFRLNAAAKNNLLVQVDGQTYNVAKVPYLGGGTYTSTSTPNTALVTKQGQSFQVSLPSFEGGAASAADGAILAPMPGKVIAVDVAEGDAVTAGQRLMVLEAMKMEHALTAPFDGTVTELAASEGGQVEVEAVLCVVEPAED